MKTIASCAALILLLTACSNAVMEPKYERNPAPRQRYVITANIDGAPGPFSNVEASVVHEVVKGRGCMPDAEPISGHFPTPSRVTIKPVVRKLSDSVYEFDVFLDEMVEKDYFGKGVCTWSIAAVPIYLKPTDSPHERDFSATLAGADLKAEQTVILFARREVYGLAIDPLLEATEPARKKEAETKLYGPDLTKFFTITLEVKEEDDDHQ